MLVAGTSCVDYRCRGLPPSLLHVAPLVSRGGCCCCCCCCCSSPYCCFCCSFLLVVADNPPPPPPPPPSPFLLGSGTFCSNLNNQKQDIDAKGESGQTFRGMMTWVEKNQPPIVILENVCSAPWQKVKDYFRQHGYAAEFMRVDTKQYYIPHTRTRVYLVAFNESLCPNADELAKTWIHMVKDMERPSSSTLEAFLLPSDDPRVHKGRERLAIPKERGATGTDWSRCESRHQRARMDEELGSKRPYTSWEAQGSCKLPDYAWNDWALVQTVRFPPPSSPSASLPSPLHPLSPLLTPPCPLTLAPQASSSSNPPSLAPALLPPLSPSLLLTLLSPLTPDLS